MKDTKTESPTGVTVQRLVRRSHLLKTWPVYFDALWYGQKTFEIRKNDRDYQVGDRLVLQEYDPERGAYLDREIHADVSYRMPGGRWGVAEDYCVMALRIVTKRWKQTPNDQSAASRSPKA